MKMKILTILLSVIVVFVFMLALCKATSLEDKRRENKE